MTVLEHRGTEDAIQTALIALALTFEPLKHIRINAYGQLLFDRPVKLAALRALPVLLFGSRKIGEVYFTLRSGSQRRQFFSDRFRYLVHILTIITPIL
ncbi:MAG: hypothetical protein L0H15_02965 [Nitrosospira sp.]|nr:hypothetical protein [Nitrosospira sp.]